MLKIANKEIYGEVPIQIDTYHQPESLF